MLQKPIIILGIESSCDDTAAAVIKNGKILANVVANQAVHEQYGGVVPELASRAHQQNIVPVVEAALKKAGINKVDLSAVAFTNGPGLLGSLLVGSSFSKAFAMGLNIPIIEVNHMQGHVLAHFIEEADGSKNAPQFPFLCLTVSGGHTQIVRINDYFDFEIIGETIDDAAGEAFDKVSKMLELPYPGGPILDKNAQQGNPRFDFPHPQVKGLNFSFSGLKTSVLYFLKKEMESNPNFREENLNDICASVQKTIIDILIINLKKAIKQTGIKEIAIAGGVSANSELRKQIENLKRIGCNTYIPKFEYCTDNAAMIAITGYYKYLNKDFSSQEVVPNARLKF